VQKGWIAIAEEFVGKMRVTIYNSGDCIVLRPCIIHNVYLSGGTVIHTVKYSQTNEKDWREDLEFDSQTKHLSELDIKRLVSLHGRKD
jgi:hypothetical protein